MPSRISWFHEGEQAMRTMLKVPAGDNPTTHGLPMSYGHRVAQSTLLAVGTLDDEGRPWTTLWGGARGFAQPIADNVLGINSAVDAAHDPVFGALWQGADADSGVVQHHGDGNGKMMSALAVDLGTRDRVKLAGDMVAGAHNVDAGDVQMAMVVGESLGNCPKYLNRKDIERRVPRDTYLVPSHMGGGRPAKQAAEGLPLPMEAVDLITRADTIFLSSTNGHTMDTNHRGGPAGFVRLASNNNGHGTMNADGDEDEGERAVVELVYPEYSGNRLYQTLGNLRMNPKVGVVIPDFETSDVLYLTGTASILVGAEAAAVIARTNLAVKISVSAAKFVKSGLPLRGVSRDSSPYNPPVRRLLSEHDAPVTVQAARPEIVARLVSRQVITPSISVFTFELSSSRGGGDDNKNIPSWRAGQHATFDFEPELGFGYSHMMDDDPQALNDDFVRTFTVSNPPGGKANEVQITARRHGPATGLLWRHNLQVPLELPFLGFGGQESFWLPTTTDEVIGSGKSAIYVAGGVGITPILAQARAVLDGGVDLRLLWSLRAEDLALAVHVFEITKGLAARTTLFVTDTESSKGEGEDKEKPLSKVRESGAGVHMRRLVEDDVRGLTSTAHERRFYLCAGPGLLRRLEGWLDGEDVVSEDFGY